MAQVSPFGCSAIAEVSEHMLVCTSLTFVGGSKRTAMLIVTVFIFLRGKETFFFPVLTR